MYDARQSSFRVCMQRQVRVDEDSHQPLRKVWCVKSRSLDLRMVNDAGDDWLYTETRSCCLVANGWSPCSLQQRWDTRLRSEYVDVSWRAGIVVVTIDPFLTYFTHGLLADSVDTTLAGLLYNRCGVERSARWVSDPRMTCIADSLRQLSFLSWLLTLSNWEAAVTHRFNVA